ncbi:high affinity immunoglobulin epsilon receptor subunit gamma [Huso huso]
MFLSGKMEVFGILVLCCCNFGQAAALQAPEICYVLDGILFVYGIVLTVLYCRLKMMSDKPPVQRDQRKKEKASTRDCRLPRRIPTKQLKPRRNKQSEELAAVTGFHNPM